MNKRKFKKFENVRKSGEYNMILDSKKVMEITGLTKDEYSDILRNYSKYFDEYF